MIRIKNISKCLNVKAKDSNHNNAKSDYEASFCGGKTCSVLSCSNSVLPCCKVRAITVTLKSLIKHRF